MGVWTPPSWQSNSTGAWPWPLSVRTAARVRLAAISSADEALCNFSMFAFIDFHLFSAGGRQSSAVTELLRFIYRLEDLHTEVQGMISSF